MSGILLASVGMNFGEPPPTVIGQVYGGGYYGGSLSTTQDGVATHYLVVAPKSSGYSNGELQWKTTGTSTTGTLSTYDGAANTAAMMSVSRNAHPAGKFCDELTIGGYTDWYLPAQYELEILYFRLKAFSGVDNNTNNGINPYSVPKRNSNYTTSVPGQTTALDFREDQPEFFPGFDFWSSTQQSDDASNAWRAVFYNGGHGFSDKTSGRYVRAIRKVPV